MNSTLTAPRGKVLGKPAVGAYRTSFQEYLVCGWAPVPVDGKVLPQGVTGYTGRTGHDPTEMRCEEWARGRMGLLNVALRCPLVERHWQVVGIDVDDYDGRAARQTLQALEHELGALPLTWRSTSRAPQDALSGIYVYRVPRGTELRGSLGAGSGIDVIQRHHRYVVAWPSRHPSTGRTYHWWKGQRMADVPSTVALPRLPRAWCEALRSVPASRQEVRMTDEVTARRWRRKAGTGAMCPFMREVAMSSAAELRQADRRGGLHDTMTSSTWRLAHYAAEGHTGLDDALRIVSRAFFTSSRKRGLRGEWDRAIARAISHAASVRQSDEDPCDELEGFSVHFS